MTKKKRTHKPVKEGSGILFGFLVGGAIGLATNNFVLATSLGIGLGSSFEASYRKKYTK